MYIIVFIYIDNNKWNYG